MATGEAGSGEAEDKGGMSPLLGRRKSRAASPSWDAKNRFSASTSAVHLGGEGWRFSLKGSPRHYDDVRLIIEGTGTSTVYFGEALTYERGAGVALWRVRATDLDWLPTLYAWWAEQERTEPVQFTFHLYIPPELKYAALDLRQHSADAVATYIREHAPRD